MAQYLPHYNRYKAGLSHVLDSLTLENVNLLYRVSMRYKGKRAIYGPFWEAGFNRDGSNKIYSRMR